MCKFVVITNERETWVKIIEDIIENKKLTEG
jgi:hypothetical protein